MICQNHSPCHHLISVNPSTCSMYSASGMDLASPFYCCPFIQEHVPNVIYFRHLYTSRMAFFLYHPWLVLTSVH